MTLIDIQLETTAAVFYNVLTSTVNTFYFTLLGAPHTSSPSDQSLCRCFNQKIWISAIMGNCGEVISHEKNLIEFIGIVGRCGAAPQFVYSTPYRMSEQATAYSDIG